MTEHLVTDAEAEAYQRPLREGGLTPGAIGAMLFRLLATRKALMVFPESFLDWFYNGDPEKENLEQAVNRLAQEAETLLAKLHEAP